MTDSPSGRRGFLKQFGTAGAGLLVGATASAQTSAQTQAQPSDCISPNDSHVAFYGTHQAGITTPVQKHIYFLVLDLHTRDIEKVREMFQQWTAHSARLTRGENSKPYSKNRYVPPADTGEADNLGAHNLTLTFGLGPEFFSKLGLDNLRPEALRELPHFPRDQLKTAYTGGDICIQACADDPQVAFHAVRNLVRSARLNITMKWSQAGFNSFDARAETPRNLFAFKDGTANFSGEKADNVVWATDPGWFNGGSYLIARRVQMFLETWDRTNLAAQNATFGRDRATGAPLGQKDEFDPVDLSLKNDKGHPAIPEISHVHLANKTGLHILRRSFSYASGIDDKGQFDAGLLFISFQKDPGQFIGIQSSLGHLDKMNEYITHIGSGIFACLPGVQDENDYLGKTLFEQA